MPTDRVTRARSLLLLPALAGGTLAVQGIPRFPVPSQGDPILAFGTTGVGVLSVAPDPCGTPSSSWRERLQARLGALRLSANWTTRQGLSSPDLESRCGAPVTWRILDPEGRLLSSTPYTRVSAPYGSVVFGDTGQGIDAVSARGVVQTFQQVRLWPEGPLAVQDVNGRWTFLGPDGQRISPTTWAQAGPFTERRAAVQCEDGLWGFVDTTGALAIPCSYPSVHAFSEGRAAAARDGHWGFIDGTGATVVPFAYDEVQDFHGGLAIAGQRGDGGQGTPAPPRWATWAQTLPNTGMGRPTREDWRWGALGRDGNVVVEIRWGAAWWYGSALEVASLDTWEEEQAAVAGPVRPISYDGAWRNTTWNLQRSMGSTNRIVHEVQVTVSSPVSGTAIFVPAREWVNLGRDGLQVGAAVQRKDMHPLELSVGPSWSPPLHILPRPYHVYVLQSYTGDVSGSFVSPNSLWEGNLIVSGRVEELKLAP